MEDKFIKINIGSNSDENLSGDIESPSLDEENQSCESVFSDPQTIPIDMIENRQEVPLSEDDDTYLVSPDAEVFTKVADNVNNDIPQKEKKENEAGFDAYDWHDTKEDSNEEI